MKQYMIQKLKSLAFVLETPQAFRAWLGGIHLSHLKTLFDLRKMGVNPSTILDIGAHEGMFARAGHEIFPQARIIAFEPIPECFEKMQPFMRTNDRFVAYNVSLGESKVKRMFHRNISTQSSSLLEMEHLHEDAFPGSSREDQGNIALYFVKHFRVENSVLEKSFSDGTHFYRCAFSWFTRNAVAHNKMGGYFVESSNNIVTEGNEILNNGSRGITIERGSRNCIVRNSTVAFSGREGLWIDDATGCLVVGVESSHLFGGEKT